MKELNLCIHLISSRTKCLKESLKSFYKHFNNKHKFQVYIYHFDNIYNDTYKQDIYNNIDTTIKFIQIDYGLPANLDYNDIYFVKTNNQKRIGYHHMCNFWSNFYNYPNTEYKKYDLAFNFDDDSLWIKDFDISYINKLIESDSNILCFNSYKYEKNHRSRNVRTGLCDLVKNYCKKYNIIPKKKWIKELLSIQDKNIAEDFFQVSIVCYDTNITKLEIYKNENHKNWMKEINQSNGIYKYRWGDNEILSLYYDIHYDSSVLQVNHIKMGAGTVIDYINPGGLRHITDYAPGVKDNKKIRSFNL
jgi:hypothetical protein